MATYSLPVCVCVNISLFLYNRLKLRILRIVVNRHVSRTLVTRSVVIVDNLQIKQDAVQ